MITSWRAFTERGTIRTAFARFLCWILASEFAELRDHDDTLYRFFAGEKERREELMGLIREQNKCFERIAAALEAARSKDSPEGAKAKEAE